MLTSRDLLAAVRAAQGLPSNYALARVLGVREKDVKRWNTCKNAPNDEMALRLAEMAGLDSAEVLAAMYAQRAADGPFAEVWGRIASRLAATVPLLALGLVGVTGSPDATAGRPANAESSAQSVYYVQYKGDVQTPRSNDPAPPA